jgi:hypothetical protein
MSMSLANPATARRSFGLPLGFLAFGVLSFLLLNGLFALSLTGIADAWFRNPWALLVTHLFTLGFVTAIIMGAVYQLLPVILETTLWSEKLGYVHLACYVTGVVTLLAGFGTMSAPLLATGGSLILTGVVLFLVNAANTMRTARHWHHSATFLICSLFYLGMVATLGFLLALNIHTGFFGAATKGYLAMHAALGFGGWFTLTIMGVAYRLIPLFTLSHHTFGARTWTALALVNLSILSLATATGFDADRPVLAVCVGVGVAGVLLFLSEMHTIIHTRVRKELDLGLRFAITAFLSLIITLALALLFLLMPSDYVTPARTVGLIYGVGMGWVALMVVGNMYKIVPFLVWTARYASRIGKEKVPTLRELYDEGPATWALRTLAAGSAMVVAGLWLTWFPLAQAGALLTTAGAALFSWGMYTIYRR